jgi:[acyl-carrier-protein] S-malonyltransferase
VKTAWLYAGQGSQTPGMGRDFYDEFPEVRGIFDSGAAGFDVRRTCFDAPAEVLSQTRYTQPCMAAFAAAVTLLLRSRGLAPDCLAGLSLGEYAALHAAGVFDADTLLELLAFRGLAMEESSAGLDTRMSAVLGLAEPLVRRAVAESAGEGVVSCTNFNCPGQIVIGGETRAVAAAEARCLALGAKRCLPVNTSGPFHTPLMESASARLREKLGRTVLAPQRVPVIFNVTAKPAPDGEVRNLLCEQVKSPVLFEQTIRALSARGADTIIEIGPGRALSGFVKKTAPEIRTVTIEKTEDLRKLEVLWS